MNKIIAVSLIGVLSFTLSGCTLLKQSQDQKQEKKQVQDTKQEKEMNKENKQDDKNVFTSIKDAVTKQIGLKCEYEDEEGVKATTYIKGKNVYLESEVETDKVKTKFKGLIKDQKYYLWGEDNKQGMVFDLSKVANEDTTTMETKVQSEEEIIAKLEQNKNNCKPENIAPSMFEAPNDVQFMEWNW